MGVVSPVGNNVESYWNSLVNGVCGIGSIDCEGADQLPAKVWARVKDFRADEQGIDAVFARKQDKFTVYALATANQAMKQAGLVSGENIDPSRLAVYYGTGIGGLESIVAETLKMDREGAKWVSPQFIPAMIPNMAAGQIAIRHNAQGAAFSLATACATSTNTIGEAYRAIKHGYADAIICGGSEAVSIPICVAAFGNMRALTKADDPQRASIPFDADRGGFVLGEGAGALVLESYDHAVKRGATILAEMCGYGATCDASHPTAPRADGLTQAAAIKEAARQAKLCGRRDVIYVNAHGTGTPLNDKCETLALHLALGRNAKKAHVSSTKSMTGHLLGAAGAIEAVASVMALRTGVIPPTIGLQNQDPACDLDYTPNRAVKANPTIALSDSLGFGGHNACIAFRKL